jgi:hypothetical protein
LSEDDPVELLDVTPVDEFQQLSIPQAPRIKSSVAMMLDDNSLAYTKGFLMQRSSASDASQGF